MATSTDKVPRDQHDRDRQPPSAAVEPRNFESQVSHGDRNYDAPIDARREPIEDEDIDTHGSER